MKARQINCMSSRAGGNRVVIFPGTVSEQLDHCKIESAG
jgi:hypothetical protein